MSEQRVGVIRDVGFGLRDLNKPCLWFTLYLDESSAALQVFTEWDDIEGIITQAGVYDVKELNGKACWYTRDEMSVRFVRVFK